MDISDVNFNVEIQVASFIRLLIVISYVIGVGFILTGILQLKSHIENSQQIPLSTPVVQLIIGTTFLYLSSIVLRGA